MPDREPGYPVERRYLEDPYELIEDRRHHFEEPPELLHSKIMDRPWKSEIDDETNNQKSNNENMYHEDIRQQLIRSTDKFKSYQEIARLLDIKMQHILKQLRKSRDTELLENEKMSNEESHTRHVNETQNRRSEMKRMKLEDIRHFENIQKERQKSLDKLREYLEQTQMLNEETKTKYFNDINKATDLMIQIEDIIHNRATLSKNKDNDNNNEPNRPEIPQQIGGPKQRAIPDIPPMPVFDNRNEAITLPEFKNTLQNLYNHAIETDPYPNDTIFNKNVRSVNRIRDMYSKRNAPHLTQADRDALAELLKRKIKQYYISQGIDKNIIDNMNKIRDLGNFNKILDLPRNTRRINDKGEHIKAIPPNFPKNNKK